MKLYGLIGYPLSHSFSRKYFQSKFEEEQILDCEYRNFEIPAITEIPGMLAAHPDLQGFNITIPYKERIIPYLNHQNAVVEKTGACNCVRITEGKLTGFNTDVLGFERSLKKHLRSNHNRALILGTGGASKAVAFVLERLGIPFMYVSRSQRGPLHLPYEAVTNDIIASYPLLINTSPVGMYPQVDTAPPIPYKGITAGHYLYDLVYNPGRTRFLQHGEQMGATVENGHDMLVIQAEESWKIWTAKPGELN